MYSWKSLRTRSVPTVNPSSFTVNLNAIRSSKVESTEKAPWREVGVTPIESAQVPLAFLHPSARQVRHPTETSSPAIGFKTAPTVVLAPREDMVRATRSSQENGKTIRCDKRQGFVGRTHRLCRFVRRRRRVQNALWEHRDGGAFW